jgi:polyhydroxybutyrate depolymerase
MRREHVQRLRLAAIMLVLSAVVLATASATSLADGGGSTPTATPSGTRPAPIIYRPAGLSAAQRVPLVIALYGADGCPQCMEGLTHFEAVANEHGFVVAYPGSVMVNGSPWQSSNDIPYISSLITQIEASQNIDPTRVYVAGFSAGGRFAYQVGCALSRQVTAIAVVSGAQRHYACALAHPVSVLAILGSLEPAVNGVAATGLPSARTVEGWWRLRNGCRQPIHRAFLAPLSEETSGPCVDGSTVRLYIVQGGQHTWPGCSCKLAPSDPDRGWNASEGIWSFFSNLQTGSLSTPGARLVSIRSRLAGHVRSVTERFSLTEPITVSQTLSLHGHRLMTSTSRLSPGAQVPLLVKIPARAKPGSYDISVRVTDAYRRTLSLTRHVRVAKLPVVKGSRRSHGNGK